MEPITIARILIIVSIISGISILATSNTIVNNDESWPDNGIVGVIGASFESCELPINTPLHGVGLAGCSYTSLTDALMTNHRLQHRNLKIRFTAQAGSYSYDVPGTDWLGRQSQYDKLKIMTGWTFDNKKRLKFLIVGLSNDCLHTKHCPLKEIETSLISNTLNVVNNAIKDGLRVIVLGYPQWESLKLSVASDLFGFEYIISEDDYNFLKNYYKDAFYNMKNVEFINVWDKYMTTINDGLHPDSKSQKNAALQLSSVILKKL